MRNIIVIECKSTGKNFIGDIINRGYNPVVLHLKNADTEKGMDFEEHILNQYKTIPYEFDIIYEQDTFEETIEEVKKFDPLLILPANERGVRIATKLSHELGLLGNPIENLDAMTLKNEMQNRLAENGLRHIKGKVVRSIDEALEFYDSESLGEIVIKPVYGAGSTSVRICLNREELVQSLKQLFNDFNQYGDILQELLIQERIVGVEYIVNTVSHKGIPRVTTIWKYKKIRTAEGANVYDSCETVNELNLGEAELIEYAYNVAEAIGVKYGPIHGEYMIDDKGPVLIEVNCRPMGGDMPAGFLDRISGQHETDSILDAYLKPKTFYESLKKRYGLYSYGIIKFFIVPKDILAISSPILKIANSLKAFYSTSLMDLNVNKMLYKKTVDVDSSAGSVFLVHKDKFEVDKNLNFLRSIERNAFSLILSDEASDIEIKDDETYLKEIEPIIKRDYDYMTCLFITDQYINDLNLLQVDYNHIDDLNGTFDYIVLNLNKCLVDMSEVDKVDIIIKALLKLKTGGVIFISKNTYQLLGSGRKGVEALIKLLDYTIVVPPYYVNDFIIASNHQ
ncbi:ATP-grasp domain-containing protein [uncultured Methanobrevibacter sp.]|uniref:ATP-grasp domain-containing protein n=1 Tax=uncultured Methanobrevibacter sp. TaxID=253161 RepID=UPI0025D0E13A|nr:ATP-grasp domain-containing protein [uncultured Methanobrevibacter sp.]